MATYISVEDIKYYYLDEGKHLQIRIDTTRLEGGMVEKAQAIADGVNSLMGIIDSSRNAADALLSRAEEFSIDMYFRRMDSHELEAILRHIRDTVKEKHIALQYTYSLV